jgi:hypothetical protein
MLDKVIEVVIVGEDGAIKRSSESDELLINTTGIREVRVRDLYNTPRIAPQSVQHGQAANASAAPHHIGTLSDRLKFIQNESRDNERISDQASFNDVEDSSINERRHIGEHASLPWWYRCSVSGWNVGEVPWWQWKDAIPSFQESLHALLESLTDPVHVAKSATGGARRLEVPVPIGGL